MRNNMMGKYVFVSVSSREGYAGGPDDAKVVISDKTYDNFAEVKRDLLKATRAGKYARAVINEFKEDNPTSLDGRTWIYRDSAAVYIIKNLAE